MAHKYLTAQFLWLTFHCHLSPIRVHAWSLIGFGRISLRDQNQIAWITMGLQKIQYDTFIANSSRNKNRNTERFTTSAYYQNYSSLTSHKPPAHGCRLNPKTYASHSPAWQFWIFARILRQRPHDPFVFLTHRLPYLPPLLMLMAVRQLLHYSIASIIDFSASHDNFIFVVCVPEWHLSWRRKISPYPEILECDSWNVK